MIKTIIVTIVILFFTGCGDKIVKLNDYKDISYSYLPHADTKLEENTNDLISDDEKISQYIEDSAKDLNKNIVNTLTRIENNQNNENLMEKTSENTYKPTSPNKLFHDRFDRLRLR